MTYRGKKLRSSPPGPRHRPPGTPRCHPLCVWVTEAKNYGAHHLDLVIGHLEHLDPALYSLWLIDTKNCGTHHPRLVTGRTNLHMNRAFYLFCESFMFRTEQPISYILNTVLFWMNFHLQWSILLLCESFTFRVERNMCFVQLCILEIK